MRVGTGRSLQRSNVSIVDLYCHLFRLKFYGQVMDKLNGQWPSDGLS